LGEGDEYLAGSNLTRFRVLAITPEMEDDAPLDGVFVVKRVE
jgi:hypothetical protein